MTLRNTNTQRNIVNDHHDQHNEIYDRLTAVEGSPGAGSIDDLSDGYTDDSFNLWLGTEPTTLSTARQNIAIGNPAFSGTSAVAEAVTTGRESVFIGIAAGWQITTGQFNIFLGKYSGQACVSGDGNVAIGDRAGPQFPTIDNSVCIGNAAAATDYEGVAIGVNAGAAAAGVSIGAYAGSALTSGTGNVMIGGYSGENLTTGSQNTFLGYAAGDPTSTGSDNTIVGYSGGSSVSTFSRNTVIGSGANAAGANNQTCIGYNVDSSAAGSIAIGVDSTGVSAGVSNVDEAAIGTNRTSLRVGDPGSGPGAWMLGTYHASPGQTLNTGVYVEVKIDGTVVKLAVLN